MSEERIPERWDTPEAERIMYETEDEAIEGILENIEGLPETIAICGYARMKPNYAHCEPLVDVLDALDQDYGDPDESTEPSAAMVEAERAFIAVIEKEYKVWAMEVVCEKTINVNEWVKTHRPEWLEATQ
jgi:hypothetical protein